MPTRSISPRPTAPLAAAGAALARPHALGAAGAALATALLVSPPVAGQSAPPPPPAGSPAGYESPPAQPHGAAPWGPPHWPASPLGAPQELPSWANPKTIDYEEGDPIPPGYELRTKPTRGFLVAGATTFGAAYAISFVAGTVALAGDGRSGENFGPLLIPLAGPFITAGTSGAEGAGIFWLMVDGVTQAGGVVLFAAGLASETTYLRRQAAVRGERPPEGPASLRPEVSIGPGSGALRWRF